MTAVSSFSNLISLTAKKAQKAILVSSELLEAIIESLKEQEREVIDMQEKSVETIPELVCAQDSLPSILDDKQTFEVFVQRDADGPYFRTFAWWDASSRTFVFTHSRGEISVSAKYWRKALPGPKE